METNPANQNRQLASIYWVYFLILVMQLPFVLRHLMNLWRFRPHYEFFPILIAIAGWMIWSRWPPGYHPTERPRRLAIVLLVVGLALSLTGIVLVSPWLSSVAFLILLGAALVRLTGCHSQYLFGPWLLLWLLIPPPFGLDSELVLWMQSFTAKTVSTMMESAGIDHLLTGNIFQLSDTKLFVAEGCSGVHSQFLLIASCCVLIVAQRRRFAEMIVLIGSAIVWSIVANIARVGIVAVAAAKYGVDLSSGWIHDLLGFTMMAIGLALVLSTDQLLKGLLILFEDPDEALLDTKYLEEETLVRPTDDLEPEDTLADRIWDRLLEQDELESWKRVSWWESAIAGLPSTCTPLNAFAAMIAMVGVLQMAVMASDLPNIKLIGNVHQLPQECLPKQVQDWSLVQYREKHRGSGSDQGEFSQIWRYTSIAAGAQISVNYPFFGWHDLTDCYTTRGWTVVCRRLVSPQTAASNPDTVGFVEVEMIGPSQEHGYLIFNHFDDDGNVYSEESTYWSTRVANNPLVTFVRGQPTHNIDETTTQIQLLLISETPISESLRESMQQLFLTARQSARTASMAGGPSHD